MCMCVGRRSEGVVVVIRVVVDPVGKLLKLQGREGESKVSRPSELLRESFGRSWRELKPCFASRTLASSPLARLYHVEEVVPLEAIATKRGCK